MEKQELMEQMLTRMDASINASQAKADKTLKETLAEMQEEIKANQAKADAHQAKMEALTGSMQAELKYAIEDLKINGEETMAYQEKTEARL
jgi:hypothetical protein